MTSHLILMTSRSHHAFQQASKVQLGIRYDPTSNTGTQSVAKSGRAAATPPVVDCKGATGRYLQIWLPGQGQQTQSTLPHYHTTTLRRRHYVNPGSLIYGAPCPPPHSSVRPRTVQFIRCSPLKVGGELLLLFVFMLTCARTLNLM